MRSKTVYVCETCGESWDIADFIAYCLGCEEELCEACMLDHSFCKKCGEGLTEDDRRHAFLKDREIDPEEDYA